LNTLNIIFQEAFKIIFRLPTEDYLASSKTGFVVYRGLVMISLDLVIR